MLSHALSRPVPNILGTFTSGLNFDRFRPLTKLSRSISRIRRKEKLSLPVTKNSERRSTARLESVPNRFQTMVTRISVHEEYEPEISAEVPWGRFCGRHIIGENTEIHGGVYLGATAHEALVVDEKYGSLKDIYWNLLIGYVREEGDDDAELDEEKLVQQVVALVEKRLALHPDEGVNRMVHDGEPEPDHKIALDVFVDRGIGAARHQILLAAYLLEKLQRKGLLEGRIYLDSHYSEKGDMPERLIYSTPERTLFVFTPGAKEQKDTLGCFD